MKSRIFEGVLFYVLVFVFAGCGYMDKATEEQKLHVWVREYPGVAKDSIYARAVRWASRREASKDVVVEYTDMETGTIITRGEKAKVYSMPSGKGSHRDYGIDYTMILDAGNGRACFEYTLYPFSGSTALEGDARYARVQVAAHKVFESITNELSDALAGKP